MTSDAYSGKHELSNEIKVVCMRKSLLAPIRSERIQGGKNRGEKQAIITSNYPALLRADTGSRPVQTKDFLFGNMFYAR